MNTFKILFSDDAKNDLRSIYYYIAGTLLEPGVASGQKNRIVAAVRSLEQMPERHPLYDDDPWRSKGFRKMFIDNYVVLYVPMSEKKEVLVVCILYAKRDINEALRENKN